MKAECMGGPLDGAVVELPDALRSFVFTNLAERAIIFTDKDVGVVSAYVEDASFEHVYQAGLLYNSANPVTDAWLWQGML